MTGYQPSYSGGVNPTSPAGKVMASMTSSSSGSKSISSSSAPVSYTVTTTASGTTYTANYAGGEAGQSYSMALDASGNPSWTPVGQKAVSTSSGQPTTVATAMTNQQGELLHQGEPGYAYYGSDLSIIETFHGGHLVPTQRVVYYDAQGNVTRIQEPYAVVDYSQPTFNVDKGKYETQTKSFFNVGSGWSPVYSQGGLIYKQTPAQAPTPQTTNGKLENVNLDFTKIQPDIAGEVAQNILSPFKSMFAKNPAESVFARQGYSVKDVGQKAYETGESVTLFGNQGTATIRPTYELGLPFSLNYGYASTKPKGAELVYNPYPRPQPNVIYVQEDVGGGKGVTAYTQVNGKEYPGSKMLYGVEQPYVFGAGVSQTISKNVGEFFKPAEKYLPSVVYSFGVGIAKNVFASPGTFVDVPVEISKAPATIVGQLIEATPPMLFYNTLSGNYNLQQRVGTNVGGIIATASKNPAEFAGGVIGGGLFFSTVGNVFAKTQKGIAQARVQGTTQPELEMGYTMEQRSSAESTNAYRTLVSEEKMIHRELKTPSNPEAEKVWEDLGIEQAEKGGYYFSNKVYEPKYVDLYMGGKVAKVLVEVSSQELAINTFKVTGAGLDTLQVTKGVSGQSAEAITVTKVDSGRLAGVITDIERGKGWYASTDEPTVQTGEPYLRYRIYQRPEGSVLSTDTTRLFIQGESSGTAGSSEVSRLQIRFGDDFGRSVGTAVTTDNPSGAEVKNLGVKFSLDTKNVVEDLYESPSTADWVKQHSYLPSGSAKTPLAKTFPDMMEYALSDVEKVEYTPSSTIPGSRSMKVVDYSPSGSLVQVTAQATETSTATAQTYPILSKRYVVGDIDVSETSTVTPPGFVLGSLPVVKTVQNKMVGDITPSTTKDYVTNIQVEKGGYEPTDLNVVGTPSTVKIPTLPSSSYTYKGVEGLKQPTTSRYSPDIYQPTATRLEQPQATRQTPLEPITPIQPIGTKPTKDEIPPPSEERKGKQGLDMSGFEGVFNLGGGFAMKGIKQRFPLSDIISKTASEIQFGRGTSPEKKKAGQLFFKSGGLRVPTAEQLKFKRRRRK